MKQILFPTEFGPLGDTAQENVVFLAKTFGCPVTLMHSVASPMVLTRYFQTDDVDQRSREARQNLDSAVQSYKSSGIEVKPLMGRGVPENAIVSAAGQSGADLIVFGTQGGKTAYSAVSGTAVNFVIRNGSAPTLTFREKPSQAGFRNILVVLDPMADSTHNLEWAAKLGSPLHAKINLIALSNSEHDEEAMEKYVENASQRMQDLGMEVLEPHISKEEQDRAGAIMEYAKKCGADLIAMLDKNTAGNPEKMGSITDQVVNLSSIPVLSTRVDHRMPELG